MVKDKDGNEKLEDKFITDKPQCRMFGMNLKNNLTWDGHLSSGKRAVLPAVWKKIGMLSRIAPNLSKKAQLQLMNSLALSKLTYLICMLRKYNP